MIAPGTLLADRYQLTQRLGNKIGRQTWLAEDLPTQKQVVVKLLRFHPDFEWVDLKLFEREAQILRSLNHPRIPRYLDYLDLDLPDCRGFALVQTYIAAQSLEQYLAAGRAFSETELQHIAASILEIFIDLHSYHPPIVHRDIKPSNILLGDRSGNHPGQVYLVDFGAVKGVGQPDGSVTIAGTYGYMPPEQLHGQATPASDLYSLGMTLIRVLTGTLPETLLFEDKDSLQLPAGVQVNPILLCWLKWMTRVNPSRRPQSAQIALQALQAIPLKPLDRLVEWRWQDDRWIAISQSVKIAKPKFSRVRLHRSEDAIAIDIFPDWLGNGIEFCFLLPLALAWNTYFWFGLIGMVMNPERNILIMFFALVFVVGGLALIREVFSAFFAMFTTTRWYIDRDRLSETMSSFGYLWSSTVPRIALTKLSYSPPRSTDEKTESAFLTLSGKSCLQEFDTPRPISARILVSTSDFA